MRKLLFGKERDVVKSWQEDSGGMFPETCGVFVDGLGYRAFVQTGWGGGAHSKIHDTIELAEADVERLWKKMFGG